MYTTIKSRKLGKDVTFFSGNGTCYVWVDLNNQSGTLGNQICYGGSLRGVTITFRGTQEAFDRICRFWFKSYIRDRVIID